MRKVSMAMTKYRTALRAAARCAMFRSSRRASSVKLRMSDTCRSPQGKRLRPPFDSGRKKIGRDAPKHRYMIEMNSLISPYNRTS
jgi:hypothetical protein